MNDIKIKICGLSRSEDILTANELNLDYVGFVFAKKSKRYVSPELASDLRSILNPKTLTVGVFVNESPDLIVQLIKDGIINIAQLHGQEDDEYISNLRNLLKEADINDMDSELIWQAFRIDTPDDIINANQSSADRVLLDHGAGGTGEVFDWSLLDGMNRQYMLAGGLTPDNVSEALEKQSDSGFLYGLDISSGVETEKKKDPEKMRLFVQNVRTNSSLK